MNKSNGILIFNLFGGIGKVNGVGYYNQLFSLELAIFMSNYFKRELHIVISKPLAVKGIGNWDYGTINDYILDINELCPYGLKIVNKDIVTKNVHNIICEQHISSCIYIDKLYRDETYKEDIIEFSNGRIDISQELDILFNNKIPFVKFSYSNASRFFYNFYTTRENYLLMNKIAIYLNNVKPYIQNFIDNIELPEKFISLHFRFGDNYMGQKILNQNNKQILSNLMKWLKLNNNYNYPLIIMCDDENHEVIKILKKCFNIKFTSEFYNENVMKSFYKDTSVVNFLIEKKICEKALTFIGTITSTVSVHIQYNNFINYKPYSNYTNHNSNSFNKDTLNFIEIFPFKKWNWSKIGYSKGHFLSWSNFFCNNIYR
jgi:hypothetical protein